MGGGGMMDGGGMMGPGGNMGPPGNNMVSTCGNAFIFFFLIIFLDPTNSYYRPFLPFLRLFFLQRVSLDLPPLSAVGGLSCHFKLWKVVGEVTRTLFRS